MLIDDTKDIYLGNNQITKVYSGNTVVYEKQNTPYTPLNYIGSTNTQQIDTNYYPKKDKTKVIMDIEFTKLSPDHNGGCIFGCVWSVNGFVLTDIWQNSQQTLRWHNGSWANTTNYRTKVGDRIMVEAYQGTVKIDGVVEIQITSGTGSMSSPLKLFSMSSSHPSYINLYSCKIYEEDNLKFDFIPVLDENGLPCLYDKVSETYFYNTGSGTFIYG